MNKNDGSCCHRQVRAGVRRTPDDLVFSRRLYFFFLLGPSPIGTQDLHIDGLGNGESRCHFGQRDPDALSPSSHSHQFWTLLTLDP